MNLHNKDINEWIKTLNSTTVCLEELEKLNEEKKKLIKLATSKNPPENIIELLEQSRQKFILLEERTKQLSLDMRNIKQDFKKSNKKS